MRNFLLDTTKFSLLFVLVLVMASWVGYLFQYDADYFTIPEEKEYLVVGDSHLECSMDDSLSGFVNISQSSEIYLFTYLKIKKVLESNPQIKYVFVDFCNFQVDQHQDSIIYSENYLNSRYPLYYGLLGKEEFRYLSVNNQLPFVKAHIKALPKVSKDAVAADNILSGGHLGGFSPLTRLLSDSSIKVAARETVSVTNPVGRNLNYLQKIVTLCKNKGVSLYLIRTPLLPEWPYLQNEVFFQNCRHEMLKEVTFLDFRQLTLGNQNFADLEHLNKAGAERFTAFFNNLVAGNLLEKENPQMYIDAEIAKYNSEN